jgi:hypothetical protein
MILGIFVIKYKDFWDNFFWKLVDDERFDVEIGSVEINDWMLIRSVMRF